MRASPLSALLLARLLPALVLALPVAVLAAGCSKPTDPAVAPPDQNIAAPPPPRAATTTATMGGAELGKPAPDFTLTDTDGKAVTLSSLKGKIVVLEWFNADCPFVKRNHTAGSLKAYGNEATAKGDVVWLAVSSSADGKQGAGLPRNKEARSEYAMTYPVLLDEGGEVGKKFGARTTPHMFVVDKAGNLAYAGSIDNAPDGEPRDTPTVVNFVGAAIEDLRAGRPVAKPRTDPWGCGVKYKS